MIKYVVGTSALVKGKESRLSHLLTESMPDSIISALGNKVASAYFAAISDSDAIVVLAMNDNEVVGYLDIVKENVFSKVLSRKKLLVIYSLLLGLIKRKFTIRQILKGSDKDNEICGQELSYIFTSPSVRGKGVGRGMLTKYKRSSFNSPFYTKTLSSNQHVVKMYESVFPEQVSSQVLYTDGVNEYIKIKVDCA